VVAISESAGVILLTIGGVLLLAAGAWILIRARRRSERPDIPPAMQPGPSDPALETPLLAKLQTWGVVLVLFFVVWIPVQWLGEPNTNLEQERDLKEQAIARGEVAVQPFTEENQLGVGCVRCHGPELRGQVIIANNVEVQAPNLTTVCGGPNTGHPLIESVDDIRQTIMQGRGAMPSWSIRFEGALHDQQIEDIVQYLVAMSSENVPFDQNVCLNPEQALRGEDGGGATDGGGEG
jgi:mono/diheme cytochrome c family protein